MSDKIRVLVCRVGEQPIVEEIVTDLKTIQGAVGGGLAQCVPLGAGVDLWCNEEGSINGMPFNRNVSMVALAAPALEGFDMIVSVGVDPADIAQPGEWGYHVVHGPFFIARDDGEGGMAPLTDEDVKLWTLNLRLDAVDESEGN